jgi:hypothetical protein
MELRNRRWKIGNPAVNVMVHNGGLLEVSARM